MHMHAMSADPTNTNTPNVLLGAQRFLSLCLNFLASSYLSHYSEPQAALELQKLRQESEQTQTESIPESMSASTERLGVDRDMQSAVKARTSG